VSSSKGEDELGRLLEEIFPHRTIKRQFPIKLGWNTIFVDFYLPGIGLAFEVDGKQHDNYVPFFHKNKREFLKSKERDYQKEQHLKHQHHAELIRFKAGEQITKEILLEKISETFS
jgi:very-short-patch-repair endonuclease